MPSPADPKQAVGADLATLLAAVPLHERARGVANLAAIATVLSSDIVGTLPNLLADSPDPDAALNLFERLCRNATPELLRLFGLEVAFVHPDAVDGVLSELVTDA